MTRQNTPAIGALLKGLASHPPITFDAPGQTPKVMVIACSDSRVDPAVLFGCDMNQIFVVRNVANLVAPYQGDAQHNGTGAALEYAVNHLEVTDIVVMGHRDCGGIKALMSGALKDQSDYIDEWMQVADTVKKAVLTEHGSEDVDIQCQACEKASVAQSVANLKTYPWIQARVETGNLHLHGWVFDVFSGKLIR